MIAFLETLPIKTIVILVASGLFIPALITLISPILRYPGVIHTVSGFFSGLAITALVPIQAFRGIIFSAGKITSTALVRYTGALGEKLENSIQDFIETAILTPTFKIFGTETEKFLRWILVEPFYKGLDQDDILNQVSKDVQAVVSSIVSIDSGRKDEDIVEDVKSQIKEKSSNISERVIESQAKSALKHIRKITG